MSAPPETVRPAVRPLTVVDFGAVPAHAVSFDEALDIIVERAHSGEGGFVLTPNVDHISISRRNAELCAAYRRCFLSLADGMPLVLLSRLLRLPLRHKVSGSDLFQPLMARCAREGLPVFFMGATAKACAAAERKLQAAYPDLQVTGHDSSTFDLEADPDRVLAVLRRARNSGARLIVVCLPPLKQLALSRFEDAYRPAVGIGAGSSLSFYVGEVQRAPAWMSRVGLEWFYRLCREPRRLWRRYLVEAAAVVPVLAGMVIDRISGRRPYRVCGQVVSDAEGASETPV